MGRGNTPAKPGFKTRELYICLPRLHTISIEENPREYPMLDFLTDRGIAEFSFWWAGVAMPIATVVVWVEIETLAKTDIFSKHPGLSDKEVRKKLKEHFKYIND
jgi:hypothetical protein